MVLIVSYNKKNYYARSVSTDDRLFLYYTLNDYDNHLYCYKPCVTDAPVDKMRLPETYRHDDVSEIYKYNLTIREKRLAELKRILRFEEGWSDEELDNKRYNVMKIRKK